MNTQIVILGAGYAGVLAAARLARQTRKLSTHITLINKTDEFVNRIRLHEQAVRQPKRTRRLADFLKGTGVEIVIGTVAALDVPRKQVRVDTAGQTREIGYDKLVVALGSTVAMDILLGAREHAFALTPNSVTTLRQQLEHGTPNAQRPVLIVGGGLTGIEAAAEFAEAFPKLHVTLATRDEVGPGLSEPAKAYTRGTLARLGVDIREHLAVTQLQDHLAQTSAGELPFEACLWAGPFVAPPLARAAGLVVNSVGQIVVDRYLQSTSNPDVYAVGDAAWLSESETPVRMACQSAAPMAAHAADNLTATLQGRPQMPFQMSFASKCISLGRKDGVVDWVHPNDSPKNKIWTGRRAALLKELICRVVPFSISNERRWASTYQVPQKREPVAKPMDNAEPYARNARSV